MSTTNNASPQVVEVGETTAAVIRDVVDVSALPQFFDRSFPALVAEISKQGVAIVGPAFARYYGPPSATVDLEVGFATDRPVRASGDITPTVLPGGRVARLVHQGSYDQLGQAWEQLQQWIAQQGLTPSEHLWEVYVTEPRPDMNPAELRTELNWVLRS